MKRSGFLAILFTPFFSVNKKKIEEIILVRGMEGSIYYVHKKNLAPIQSSPYPETTAITSEQLNYIKAIDEKIWYGI